MDEARVAELCRRQGGVISAAQLRACGLGTTGVRRRVIRHRLFVAGRSVYSLAPSVDAHGRRWAAVLATDPERAVISHRSAAEVHRMVESAPGPVHVTVPGGGRPDHPGVRIHRTRRFLDEDVVLVHGLRTTSPARTVLDVARRASDGELRRLIREGEFQGRLADGDLRDGISGRSGHRGQARIRRVDPATVEAALRQTPLEDDLALILERLDLRDLARQLVVRGVSGSPYRCDFAFPSARLLVEADGRAAHDRSLAFEEDRVREADLGAAGWQTLRFTRVQVLTTPGRVARTVAETVGVRRRQLGGTVGPPGLRA